MFSQNAHLWPVVQLKDPDANITDLWLGGPENCVPVGAFWQWNLELPRCEVNAGTGHSFRLIPAEKLGS